MLVYDITNPSSFEHAKKHWLTELHAAADEHSSLGKCTMLLGNKIDLEKDATPEMNLVASDEHEEMAKEMHLLQDRASAKTGAHILRAFRTLIIRTCEHFSDLETFESQLS